jgi:type I restriction enzyme, R subunit
MKEASARIKINRLLEAAGWRFFDVPAGPANIRLEPSVRLKSEAELESLGANFEKASKGFVDFLLLNEKGFPLIVLEAKAEDKNPLNGKEQARKYARSLNSRFVILSNGNVHYFWDLERGNPHLITAFPTPSSVTGYQQVVPDKQRLIDEIVDEDYVVHTQRPNYASEAAWLNLAERPNFIVANALRFLRAYQKNAVKAVQAAVARNLERFLLEMATGTGKTLVAAAIIRLFLRTRNASRVLFLVDRLELEDQAWKAFTKLLKNDFKTVIYKENRDDWRSAEIVVTTVQSLLFNNKYQRQFSPTDFDLVISDEAHRSINGNARAVFDYFVGYKLGLTATPKDYLKNFNKNTATTRDPREFERRLLLDTYRTFGCDDGQPTFRYSLLDGVKDGFLINPTVVDARSDVTTQLLSEQGYAVVSKDENGQDQSDIFEETDFEKRFFSDATNRLFCRTFLEHAHLDPVSGEVGKSIVFAVSQNHAAKLTQILNEMADLRFVGKYQSDFAVQVTSNVQDSQQHTINFTNNNLLGSANFLPPYRTTKARVCVTVGMMTTGYDCPDILNLGLFRPVFSPTDFIQIKGRGTRKHDFSEQVIGDPSLLESVRKAANGRKISFKLFDFFGNCEYFEDEFNYDQVIELPKRPSAGGGSEDDTLPPSGSTYTHQGEDDIADFKERFIGMEGMKIDRMFFNSFEQRVLGNDILKEAVESGQWDAAIAHLNNHVFNKPAEFYTLEKLRKAIGSDRRITIREILEKIFGLIPAFKSKDEVLEEEFAKFIADYQPAEDEIPALPAIKTYFKAYATDTSLQQVIDTRRIVDLSTNPSFSTRDFRAVPTRYRDLVPSYVKDYVSLNQFAA